jgi:hypothetical protein
MRHFTEEATLRRAAAAASRQLVGGWWDTFDDYETCAYAMILPSGPWSTNAIIACIHRFWWCESLCAPHQSPS